jgi:hypothetical protein
MTPSLVIIHGAAIAIVASVLGAGIALELYADSYPPPPRDATLGPADAHRVRIEHHQRRSRYHLGDHPQRSHPRAPPPRSHTTALASTPTLNPPR